MKNRRNHIACKVGDHSGNPLRDVPPDHTPVTVYTEDGKVWFVGDVPCRYLRAVRVHAREEGVSLNRKLSEIVVEGFTKLIEKGGRP